MKTFKIAHRISQYDGSLEISIIVPRNFNPNYEKCIWSIDDNDGSYDTGCGNKYIIIDGTPRDNNMNYCPYCGRVIIEELTNAHTDA